MADESAAGGHRQAGDDDPAATARLLAAEYEVTVDGVDLSESTVERARVLRPAGRVVITDVVVAEDGLPAELTTLAAWVACIADAHPIAPDATILARAGLVTGHVEEHDEALARMVEQVEARVRVLRTTAADRLAAAGVAVDAVLRYTALAGQAVADGLIGYRLVVAEKPA